MNVRSKKEVVSLPFHSESQGAISKNSFSCLLNIVTCDRGVGRRTPFIRKKGCDNIFVTALFVSPETTADNRHLLFYRKKSKYQIRKKRPNNPIIGTKKIPAIKHKLINIEIKLDGPLTKLSRHGNLVYLLS